MVSLKLIRVSIYVSFVFILLEQVWCQDTDKETCPEEHRCRERNMCRPSSMKLIRGRPTACGYSSRGRPNICCPEKSRPPVPSQSKPPTQPSTPEESDIGIGTPDIKPVPLNPGNCGISYGKASREGYVVGGEDAEQGAWPWMVAIMDVNKRGVQSSVCTGYLIDSRHVLTAAHCFTGKEDAACTGFLNNMRTDAYCFKGKKYSTRIGHVNLTLGDEYPISRIALHKGYRKSQFYNDIALLTLSKDVDVLNFNPICLMSSPSFSNLTGKGTTVAGWGATIPGGPTSLILKQLSEMPVVSNEMCDRIYRDKFTNYNRQFPRGISSEMTCAGFLNEPGKDSCMGDSGGPLMFQREDRWYAFGIVSFGYECGKPGLPGGYTRVSEYLPWINQNKN